MWNSTIIGSSEEDLSAKDHFKWVTENTVGRNQLWPGDYLAITVRTLRLLLEEIGHSGLFLTFRMKPNETKSHEIEHQDQRNCIGLTA